MRLARPEHSEPFRARRLTGTRREPAIRAAVIAIAACVLTAGEHLRVPYDLPAIQLVKNALKRVGPADPSFRPVCATF